MSRKAELLEIEPEEPEMLFAILSKLPKPLDLDGLISRTLEIFHQCPPEALPFRAWSNVSASSVLKTTHDRQRLATQSLSDGERMFQRQAAEIRRAEKWEQKRTLIRQTAIRYRRPATFAGTAVFTLLAAYYLRDGRAYTMLASCMSLVARSQQHLNALLQKGAI
jgi:TBC1 domain family member 20